MPHDLAADPAKTVFDYDAIVSPPKDWERWHELVRDLTAHLVERYGDEVVEHWSFEVWNEANLEVFWSGTPEEYLRLYDVTADAVRSVDPRLVRRRPVVGGRRLGRGAARARRRAPACRSTSSPPTPTATRRSTSGRRSRATAGPAPPIWWTEWGVTPTHFNEVSDAVFAGTFLLRGMASAMGRIEALSYWVVSDHFEELGRPPRAAARRVRAAHRRRAAQAAVVGAGDAGAARAAPARRRRSPATAAARSSRRWPPPATDGTVTVLAWNLTLDQTKAAGLARARPRRPGRGDRARARGDVPAGARAGRPATTPTSRPPGAPLRATARTGPTTSSGPRCGRPTGSRSSSRRATVRGRRRRHGRASTSRCRCRR